MFKMQGLLQNRVFLGKFGEITDDVCKTQIDGSQFPVLMFTSTFLFQFSMKLLVEGRFNSVICSVVKYDFDNR